MGNALARMTRRSASGVEARSGMDWWLSQMAQATSSPVTTYGPNGGERVDGNYGALVAQAYRANGVVFAVSLARMLLFTEARFKFRALRSGRPGDLFGTPALQILERPWRNGTTGELLGRMEQDVTLAGNCFIWYDRKRRQLRRLRPDWVTVVSTTEDPLADREAEVKGYLYGPPSKPQAAVELPVTEVVHWSPIPDPLAVWRGMSWLTPILREIDADSAATSHKLEFFENAATPNMVVQFDASVTMEQVRVFSEMLSDRHAGLANAYKTLVLGGGADAKVVGSSMEQMDFKVTQGAGETRIAAAGGVPPVIVGLSEGLQAATYSNYGQARRKFADGWARPTWRSAAAALANIIEVPSGAELWYDDRDIPFLQEDQKDAAEIRSVDAVSIKALIEAGYDPDAVIAAVAADDLTLLAGSHTGMLSVQLQPPGLPEPAPSPVVPAANGNGNAPSAFVP